MLTSGLKQLAMYGVRVPSNGVAPNTLVYSLPLSQFQSSAADSMLLSLRKLFSLIEINIDFTMYITKNQFKSSFMIITIIYSAAICLTYTQLSSQFSS